MQPSNQDFCDDNGDEFRRSIHDVSAAIIYTRTLAETLAEHVPGLVSMVRAKYAAIETPIPPRMLDLLPSIPTEIIELCEIAHEALRSIGAGAGTTQGAAATSDSSMQCRLPNSPKIRLDGEGAKILLVEDEEADRYILSRALETQGCHVTSVSSGEDALRLLEEQDFCLIFMDLRIPGIGGCETVKRIRQKESAQGRFTRIVGLTASPLLDDQQRAKAAGMDEVLVKPIDAAAVQSVLSWLA